VDYDPFLSLQSIALENLTEVFSKKTLSGDQGQIVWASPKAGCHAKAHSHAAEQIFWIQSGSMRCRIGDQVRDCGPGDLVLVKGWIEHEMWVLEDTEFVAFLAPVREDLRSGAELPAHLRTR
jgi:quercetin dioxygenase-like cupin family protein